MKLNPDCIRDILLFVEPITTYDKGYLYQKDANSELSERYSHNEIIYHIKQAKDSGLIATSPFYDGGKSVYIIDLTPTGHEFLANIRTKTVWQKIKTAGIESLPIMLSLAKDLAMAYYQTRLQGFSK